MPNPMNFDSDWDYYDACMTPKQRVMQAIDEGTRETDNYLDWGLVNYPEFSADELMANDNVMGEYAEYILDIEAALQEPS